MKSDLPNFWRFFERVTGKSHATEEKRDPGHEKERTRGEGVEQQEKKVCS